MKGGIAAMVIAAETLAATGELRGDVIVCTNTDEESSGVGALACARRGVAADFAIVPEPSGLEVWPACRGSAYCEIVRAGARRAHRERAGGLARGRCRQRDRDGAPPARRRRAAAQRVARHAPPPAPGSPDRGQPPRRRLRLVGDAAGPRRDHARGADPPGPGRRRRLDAGRPPRGGDVPARVVRRRAVARRAPAELRMAHRGQPVRDAGGRGERAGAAARQRRRSGSRSRSAGSAAGTTARRSRSRRVLRR